MAERHASDNSGSERETHEEDALHITGADVAASAYEGGNTSKLLDPAPAIANGLDGPHCPAPSASTEPASGSGTTKRKRVRGSSSARPQGTPYDDPLSKRISELAWKRRAMKKDAQTISGEIKVQERRRSRMIRNAKKLTNDELVQIVCRRNLGQHVASSLTVGEATA